MRTSSERNPQSEESAETKAIAKPGILGRATSPVGAAPSAGRGLPALPNRRWLRYAEGLPFSLLVGNRGAGWSRKMDNFEAFEADFAAPFLEIGGRIIERIAEFDQHV